MKYRIKKLLIIPDDTKEVYDKRLKSNQIVICEPLSFQGYNFIKAINNVIYKVPVTWLHTIKKSKKMFKKYKRVSIAELREVTDEEIMSRRLASNISISPEDIEKGHPFAGDMIARNPSNHNDQWLVAGAYFKDNFISAEDKTLEDFVEPIKALIQEAKDTSGENETDTMEFSLYARAVELENFLSQLPINLVK